jgi:hypothetical protein
MNIMQMMVLVNAFLIGACIFLSGNGLCLIGLCYITWEAYVGTGKEK